MRALWHSIFHFWERYEHHIGVGALVVGFLFDLWVADRPDSIFNNLLLLSYLFLAGAFIIILNLRARRRPDDATPLFLLLMLQFCFGGLASNLLVLYGHSGTLTGSAVFIGILVLIVFGNEYFRSRYSLLRFNIGVYYFLMLSYALVAVPIFITHSLGILTFFLSGIISIMAISGFLILLFFAVFRGSDTGKLKEVSFIIGGIFCVFNLLYFLNVIPPVPLSLRDIDVYHSVLKRADGTYLALYEPAPWYQFWRSSSERYTSASGTAACFSAVFAPADLQTPIYHVWEYKNATGEWEQRSKVPFPIQGGRAEGYRGFSTKSALTPGEWRCNVETASGALIGRVGFVAVWASTTPALSQTTL
ncbi:hypothetical protein A3D70_01105 [Candidatus Adlerbacteria bacterium RIFCSPHIGHO2_02_FULL_54_18]|uniref:DUF2914 domain-containing protein n=2 Tax=Candidatus Adleribacteriota TaxID=1752736 RepID=A0A1F4Y5G6_9BACT|nr:MAG: hypothetical protein A2949_02040 [Candidatus Adlerbacteria bacterium RIFCSPLOWO2_01_FULL_54_21b]OGC89016.1 MAG: hypothetical protein A3D70_01105 [Candidatus Adlerbacteria bacterium RIFCSPHIGHO2_02_FULL_54_18]